MKKSELIEWRRLVTEHKAGMMTREDIDPWDSIDELLTHIEHLESMLTNARNNGWEYWP